MEGKNYKFLPTDSVQRCEEN